MKKIKILIFIYIFSGLLYGQWQPDVRITTYPTYVDYGSNNNAWTIAVKDSFVHIVWEHKGSPSIGELYYIRSTNTGTTFCADTQLTTQDSHSPSIAVYDSTVHIAWVDYRDGQSEIYYKRSIDNGMNWEPDVRLTNNSNHSLSPSIAVNDSIVNVVWVDDRTGSVSIYYKRSIDKGVNWGADTKLINNTSSPSIAVSDSIVHITWADDRTGNWSVYYKHSIDNGTNWGPDVRLTIDPDTSLGNSSIAVKASTVHTVWRDRDWRGIHYERSNDGGMSWGAEAKISSGMTGPSIAVWDSIVHIVFISNYEVSYNYSVDNGISWETDTALTVGATAGCASIACRECPYDVHIVWTDSRDGNEEIYYKRHKCEGGSVEESSTSDFGPPQSDWISDFKIVNTKIYLSIPNTIEANIKIYDLCGRLKSTVYNGVLSKGNYTFMPNIKTNGIYFVRLTDGNYKETKKLILMK